MARSLVRRLVGSLDSWEIAAKPFDGDPHKADWGRVIPFVVLHLSCLLVLLVGWSPVAVGFAVGFYGLRMFAITAFYHRYFSHRAFKTSRAMQFLFALLGLAAVQKGPLWWAAHHRNHHRNSDQEGDVHSPKREGLWHSHVGWILCRNNLRTRLELVGDLAKFPELRFLDRFDLLVPILLIPILYGVGAGLQALWPGLGTSGLQFLVWGFAISTVALYHCTFTINSLAHRLGSRRFDTPDDSRNNAMLSLLTLGEGWHNNHHHYPGSVRMGFRWWEIDMTYYLIKAMAVFGLVWDLRPLPLRLQ